MKRPDSLKRSVARFLDAWLGARQLIQAANFNRFQRAGLSATQFMTLNLIPAEEAGRTLGELARRMNLGAATLTKTVDSLEARGLLTRTRSEVDRRQVILALTDDGYRLQNAASAEFHEHMAGLFRSMSADERDGLVVGLEGLIAASGGRGSDRVRAGAAAPAGRSAPPARRRRS